MVKQDPQQKQQRYGYIIYEAVFAGSIEAQDFSFDTLAKTQTAGKLKLSEVQKTHSSDVLELVFFKDTITEHDILEN